MQKYIYKFYIYKFSHRKFIGKIFSRNNAKFIVSQKGIENQLVRHSRTAR